MSPLFHDPALVIANRWQRDFPLAPRPFAEMGVVHELTEAEVIAGLERLRHNGVLSRVGAVVRPHAAGASTLAALACPPERLERVAAMVSAERFVNHNYEREHPINLWFVVAAPCDTAMVETLARIEARSGCEVLGLRLERPYHIDLGFALDGEAEKKIVAETRVRAAAQNERWFLAAIEDGLPLCARPFAAIGKRLGWNEDTVIAVLARLVEDRVIARFGCVIRHRRIGFTANAMAVWDVPEGWVDAAGFRLAGEAGVTLCYRRNRAPPRWPYNLFAMVHGQDEGAVRKRIGKLSSATGLAECRSDILFSRRCFTQRGARFSPALEAAA